jgi:hypothetical protein
MARNRVDWKQPDYTTVYEERERRLARIRADHEAWEEAGREGRSPWDEVHSYYADHPADWIEDWLYTYDPRLVNIGRDPFMPFLLFPKQRELIEWIEARYKGREDGLVEKSRDTGISWICLAWALHKWIHVPGFKCSFGSRKEDLVDKMNEPDSLLEKIRIMLRRLPSEMRPHAFEEDDARYMKILNRENGAVIGGEAGENIGRGGRSSVYFVDEAAFLENPKSVDAALSQNTEVRIDVSTPNGKGNPFADKRFGGIIAVFSYHWRNDPRKDEDWYARQARKLDPQILAQEVDLDYETSGDETAIPARYVRAARDLHDYLKLLEELPDADHDGSAGLDVGGERAPSVFVPRWGPLVGKSIPWTDPDTTNTAGRAEELASQYGCPRIFYDVIGVGKGVLATFRRMRGAKTIAVNSGSTEGQKFRKWPDGKMANEKFVNLRAEIWWIARDRLRKTYEHWLAVRNQGGMKHPLDELLLLPDDPILVGQLSMPGYDYTSSGKILIERKEAMAARNQKSPDHADALMLTFMPEKARARFSRSKGLV